MRSYWHYRIYSRKPGEQRWKYLAFTGSTGRDLDKIKARIARAEQESPGWSFTIAEERVDIRKSGWRLEAPS